MGRKKKNNVLRHSGINLQTSGMAKQSDLSQGMLVSDAYGGWGCGDLFRRVGSNQSGQET